MHKDGENGYDIGKHCSPSYNNIISIPKWDVIEEMSFHSLRVNTVSRTNRKKIAEIDSVRKFFVFFLFGRKQLTLKGRFFNIILNNNYNKNEWKSSKWNNKIYREDSERCGRLCVVQFY